jgi:hypothetical protein
MARQTRQYRIRVRGNQREHIDADLLAQIVIMMGRQLAREARGESPEQDETLPIQRRDDPEAAS